MYAARNISNTEEISNVFSCVSMLFCRGIVNAVAMDEY